MSKIANDFDAIVSIIVPVYNTPFLYLQQCFDCILHQTFSNWECIIINDGSTKQLTIESINAYAQKDKRFVVVNQKNNGQGYARNAGIEVSNGDYLTFLDSDDFWNLDFLEKLYIVAKNSNADIVCSQIENFIGDDFCKKNTGIYLHLINNIIGGKLSKFNERKFTKNKTIWGKIYKKEIFNNLRFPILKNEDIFVIFATMWKASVIYISKDTCYHYRIHDGSDVNSFREGKIDDACIRYIFDAICVYEEALKFFIEHEKKYSLSRLKKKLILDIRGDLRSRRKLLIQDKSLLKLFDEKLLSLADKYGEYFSFSLAHFTRKWF